MSRPRDSRGRFTSARRPVTAAGRALRLRMSAVLRVPIRVARAAWPERYREELHRLLDLAVDDAERSMRVVVVPDDTGAL